MSSSENLLFTCPKSESSKSDLVFNPNTKQLDNGILRFMYNLQFRLTVSCLVIFFFISGCGAPNQPVAIFPYAFVNGCYGAIDEQLTFIIPPIYDSLGEFVHNVAVYEIDGKQGFIDGYGRVLIPPTYDKIMRWSGGGFYAFSNGASFILDLNGNAFPEQRGYKGKLLVGCGLIAENYIDEIILKDFLGKESFRRVANSLSIVDENIMLFENEGIFTYVNCEGIVVFETPKFDEYVHKVEKGRLLFIEKQSLEIRYENGEIHRHALQTRKKWIALRFIEGSPNSFVLIADFEGTIPVFGFASLDGDIIVPPLYRRVGSMSEGFTWVECQDSKRGFVNEFGELIIPCIFDNGPLYGGFKNGIACMVQGSRRVFIDKKGEILAKEGVNYIMDSWANSYWCQEY